MKRLYSLIRGLSLSLVLFMLTLLTFAFTDKSKGKDCDTETLTENCASELDDYVFMKSFDIKTKNEENKVEYSYVLSRDVTYRIVICEMESENRAMVVNLYDRAHKLITSNQIKGTKKLITILNYQCAATGVYYVDAHFERKNGGCGLNIVGFKR